MQPQRSAAPHSEFESSLGDVVALFDSPAAVVADGDEVVANNPQWDEVACPAGPAERVMLEHSLHRFAPTGALVESLRSGSPSVGMMTMIRSSERSSSDEKGRPFVVRWRRLRGRQRGRSVAVVVLHDSEPEQSLSSLVASHRLAIHRLLLRQTLTEEAERRRIGRALHDVVVQDLVLVRAAIVSGGAAPEAASACVESIDRVIGSVRTLSFELSPPVLEDLGLGAAVEWLAEHLCKVHGARISVRTDGAEPGLSRESRLVVFRSIRELLLNAVKHAPGADIIVAMATAHGCRRIVVQDDGPGFDPDRSHGAPGGRPIYGLLSVEQQIRSIGGSFDLSSVVGGGTRVTLSVPLEPEGTGCA